MENILKPELKTHLHQGTVIPAHPLALNEDFILDEKRQRLLTRYYMASGAGGLAVGVHTTQFEIRKPEINLLDRVLQLAGEEIDAAKLARPFLKIAGVCGPTAQAIKEAELAVSHGYHIGLLSLGGLNSFSDEALIEHIHAVAEVIPVFGFYLQPAVGGRLLSYKFWRKMAEIPNVVGVKIAAFNRYQTLEAVRGLCESDRCHDIALYTGNDDNIVADLLTPYRFMVGGEMIEKRFVGGLLGHWAVWTGRAVKLLEETKICVSREYDGAGALLAKGIAITDMNAVLFDAENGFLGCIAGIHEVLRRQGIMKGTWCLNPKEKLSEGQSTEIDRVLRTYPDLIDDDFVRGFLELNQELLN
ncbi:dihydrodipicolinate synthase family protein [Dyadobacter tibetensis]|uniref:dihydrodipicolinate synthase family protein n=1 Tax=Dyadobacter tibetensis TaxID=1211851 RepID=UPI0004727BE9|nr:dihydrodipicolinate synthase family protein [Dyadobacter tibetensis]